LPKIIPNELSEYLGFSKRFGLNVHTVTANDDKVSKFNVRINLMFKYLVLMILTALHWIRIKIPIKFKILLKK
jgi:hypothetical protein